MRRYRFALAICLLLTIHSATPGLGAQEKAASPRLRPSGIDGAASPT